jgi:murein L,D-transpeptidase YafK
LAKLKESMKSVVRELALTLLLPLGAATMPVIADESIGQNTGQSSAPIIAKSGPWLSVPVSGDFYLVMDKSRNELTVRSLSEPGKLHRVIRAISGANLGDKEREGDKKTPEGIYFVERKIPGSQLQKLHGAGAFALNFPNAVDHILKRSGSGIWLHGVDNEARLDRRFDTLGCVAIGNSDIVDLGQRLNLKGTPLVIVSEEKKDGKGHSDIGIQPADGSIGHRVQEWVKAWSSRDPEKYLSFYSKDFFSMGKDYAAWAQYKTRLTKQYKFIDVKISDLKILQHGKYSVAIFNQDYSSDRLQVKGYKRLYLVGQGADAQILAEEVAQEAPPSYVPLSLPVANDSPQEQQSSVEKFSAERAPSEEVLSGADLDIDSKTMSDEKKTLLKASEAASPESLSNSL